MTTPRTLLDLHRHVKICEISDGTGVPIQFALQAPNQAEHFQLMTLLNEEQARAEAEFKVSPFKDQLMIQALGWTQDELIELVLSMELGPPIDDADATDAEQLRMRVEDLAIKRRQERRRDALKTQSIEMLRTLYVDLQARVTTITQATSKWSMAQLCIMVRHATPNELGIHERIFTEREDQIDDKCAHCGRGTPQLNYIGLLATQTVDALMAERARFLSDIAAPSSPPVVTKSGRKRITS